MSDNPFEEFVNGLDIEDEAPSLDRFGLRDIKIERFEPCPDPPMPDGLPEVMFLRICINCGNVFYTPDEKTPIWSESCRLCGGGE